MTSEWKLLVFGVVAIAFTVAALVGQSMAPESIGTIFRSYSGLLVGMTAGLFGAAFSMLTQSQRRASSGTLYDVDVAAQWHTIVVRGAFGVGAATIIYFFFESGLLEGSLWPDLEKLGWKPIAGADLLRVPNKDLCLLVIWCFIAGFSESFVPNVLVHTEGRANSK